MGSTINVNAEVIRQLSYIVDDEHLMRKALDAIKSIVSQRETDEEKHLLSRSNQILREEFQEALRDTLLYKQGKIPFVAAEELLNEL